MKIEIIDIELKDIKKNPNNPRIIKDGRYKKLKNSLKDFPEMKAIREIVIDEDNIILGGNMRVTALLELGEKIAQVKRVSGLSEKQKEEFIIKDNVTFGEWDLSALARNWDNLPISDWGASVQKNYRDEEIKNKILTEEEIIFQEKFEEELIDKVITKIKKVLSENPKKINSAISIIIQNGSGNDCLFLLDPSTKDIVIELKRIALSEDEYSPLETLVRSLYDLNYRI